MARTAWIAPVYPAYVFWRDNRTLEVLVHPVWRSKFHLIRTTATPGLSIETRVIKDEAKANLCDSSALEVVATKPTD